MDISRPSKIGSNFNTYMKFTMTHTTPTSLQSEPRPCSCEPIEAIPYLDTLCQIKDGKIITDLYKKECDRNQYLLTSSIHPIECFRSIPYSLCMRINRICSQEEAREKWFMELRNMLLDRGYTPGIKDAAIVKARAIPRQEALMCVSRQDVSDRPTFVV